MDNKKTIKRKTRMGIIKKLLTTFKELNNGKGSKKVEESVRKASKALAKGLEAVRQQQLKPAKKKTALSKQKA
ncbi:MAG: hypothetical protein ACTHLE_00485 [Agriterribacter sp.]